MAKRKTPTTNPGEIRNPVKAAALMTCIPIPHLPVDVVRTADGMLCTFFNSTPQFMADSKDYDRGDLAVMVKHFVLVRSRLLDMKEYGSPDVSALVRAVQN